MGIYHDGDAVMGWSDGDVFSVTGDIFTTGCPNWMILVS